MKRHFRLELNIGSDDPLPKILEEKQDNLDLSDGEKDPRTLFPATVEEQAKIEVT